MISLLICRPDEHGQKTRSGATRRWRLSVLTAETLFLVVVIRTSVSSLHSLQSCLHLADWHQWQLVYLKQISPPAAPRLSPAPPSPAPSLICFPNPLQSSRQNCGSFLQRFSLCCSRYFVIFSKPVSGEAVNIWFCWDCCETLKFYSQSTNRNWGRQVAGLKIKW